MRKHAWKNNRRNVWGTVQNFFYMYIHREQLVHLYYGSSVCTSTDNYWAEVQFLDTLHAILILTSVINTAVVKAENVSMYLAMGMMLHDRNKYYFDFSCDSIKCRPEHWIAGASVPSPCTTNVAAACEERICVTIFTVADSCALYAVSRKLQMML